MSRSCTPRSGSCWWNGIFWRKPPVDEPRSAAPDDRGGPFPVVGGAAVRVGLDQPVGVLPPAYGRDAAEPGADAADRRAVPGNALVRLAADGAAPAARGLRGRPQAHPAADGQDGPGADPPAAADYHP